MNVSKNVLTGVATERVKTKSTLKNHSCLPDIDSKELFGKSFRKPRIVTAKVRKESKEAYWKSLINNSDKKLFQKSP